MAGLLNSHGCVVEHSEQHRERSLNCYFQRMEFDYSSMRTDTLSLERAIKEVCGRLQLEWQLDWNSRPKQLCIMVSKRVRRADVSPRNRGDGRGGGSRRGRGFLTWIVRGDCGGAATCIVRGDRGAAAAAKWMFLGHGDAAAATRMVRGDRGAAAARDAEIAATP